MEPFTHYFSNNIKDKRIIITGGTTGIGRATAELLVSSGSRVFIFGRDKTDFRNAYKQIRSKYKGCELYGCPADITDAEDVERVFKSVNNCLGGMDILINNAALGADGIVKGDRESWKYIIDTNIMGYLTFAKEAVTQMSEKGGHIVNIGSMSADIREHTGTIYVTTKAAIQGFSTALRKEVNPLGIKVSLIEPGAVTSDMQPGTKAAHRKKIDKMEMLEASDIAMSILFCLAQPKRCDIVSLQVRPHLQII